MGIFTHVIPVNYMHNPEFESIDIIGRDMTKSQNRGVRPRVRRGRRRRFAHALSNPVPAHTATPFASVTESDTISKIVDRS